MDEKVLGKYRVWSCLEIAREYDELARSAFRRLLTLVPAEGDRFDLPGGGNVEYKDSLDRRLTLVGIRRGKGDVPMLIGKDADGNEREEFTGMGQVFSVLSDYAFEFAGCDCTLEQQED